MRVDEGRVALALGQPDTEWADTILKKLEQRRHLVEGILFRICEDLSLRVMTSQIKKAGLGLFSTKDLVLGDLVSNCFGFLVYQDRTILADPSLDKTYRERMSIIVRTRS